MVGWSHVDAAVERAFRTTAGSPAVQIETIPDCGCDAFDSGSQDVLDLLRGRSRPGDVRRR